MRSAPFLLTFLFLGFPVQAQLIKPPRIDVPKFTPPKVNVPKFTPPKVDVPKFTPPKVDVPKFTPPKIDMPQINVGQKLDQAVDYGKQGIDKIGKAAQDAIDRADYYKNERAYYAYRDYYIGQNGIRVPIILRPGSLHYDNIEPVLGRAIDIERVAVYFDATVPSGMSGITFGNSIYIRGPFRPNDPNQTILLAHEFTHSAQVNRMGGEKEFGRKYVRQIGGAIMNGQFSTSMHDHLGLEKEANSIAAQVAQRFNNTYPPGGGVFGQVAGIGNIVVTNNYSNGVVEIALFHPQNSGSVFATWKIPATVTTSLTMSDKPVVIGGDWGIGIKFGNGMRSEISRIQAIGTFQNGTWRVDATRIFENGQQVMMGKLMQPRLFNIDRAELDQPRQDQIAGRDLQPTQMTTTASNVDIGTGETYAANLGIYYSEVRYEDGTFGARITRPPVQGTPAGQLGLEPGDIVYMMDNQRFRTHTDVLSHKADTTVNFVNVRTNAPQAMSVVIP